MKKCVIVAARSAHQQQWGGAFLAGIKRHGWSAEISAVALSCDLLVMWSVRRHDNIKQQVDRGGEVCILERGYIGDRTKWTSVSFGGGLNGRGIFRGDRTDPARFDNHFGHLMLPWRHDPGYVLIMGQVEGDMSLRGLHAQARWEAAAAHYAAAKEDVRFRPHPLAKGGYVRGAKGLKRTAPLAEALAGAQLVVTINSNAGVDSALAGVPVVALDDRSMAWDVATHDFAAPPIRPSRQEWATRIAWSQWSEAEIESGACWAHVGRAR